MSKALAMSTMRISVTLLLYDFLPISSGRQVHNHVELTLQYVIELLSVSKCSNMYTFTGVDKQQGVPKFRTPPPEQCQNLCMKSYGMNRLSFGCLKLWCNRCTYAMSFYAVVVYTTRQRQSDRVFISVYGQKLQPFSGTG